MVRHQEHYYGGAAWANELARRGYVVLVHDAFTFGSRGLRLADLPAKIRGDLESNPEAAEEIERYNQFRGARASCRQEPVQRGTTWPGVFG